MKGFAAHPGLLHEFELALDIAIEAHKHQAVILAFLRHIGTADAQDAVTIADVDLILRAGIKTVARIGPADMGAKRAPQPLWIFGAKQKIIIFGIAARCARFCIYARGSGRYFGRGRHRNHLHIIRAGCRAACHMLLAIPGIGERAIGVARKR